MGDRVAKLALALSLTTLALVIGGALIAYATLRGLAISQLDSAIDVLQDLRARKISVPIRIDRVVEVPINHTITIGLNESIPVPVSIDVPVDVPVRTTLEVPIRGVSTSRVLTTAKSYVEIEGRTYELEVPIDTSIEVPVELVSEGFINRSFRALAHINTTLTVNLVRTVRVPVGEVVRVPVKIEMVYELSLRDLGLDALVDRLISALKDIRARI